MFKFIYFTNWHKHWDMIWINGWESVKESYQMGRNFRVRSSREPFFVWRKASEAVQMIEMLSRKSQTKMQDLRRVSSWKPKKEKKLSMLARSKSEGPADDSVPPELKLPAPPIVPSKFCFQLTVRFWPFFNFIFAFFLNKNCWPLYLNWFRGWVLLKSHRTLFISEKLTHNFPFKSISK